MQCNNSGTFRLRMFFMVSSFKEKKNKLKLQKAQSKHIRFYLNLPSRSRIDLSHFRKIKLRLTMDRVEHCIDNIVFKH